MSVLALGSTILTDCSNHRANHWFRSGIQKHKKGDHQDAFEDCTKSISVNPMNANACNNHGIAENALNNHQAEVDGYNKVIELNTQIALHYSIELLGTTNSMVTSSFLLGHQ